MPPRPTGDTQPCQDSVVSARKGSHGLLGIIQTRWAFESYWMIQRCICLARMGKHAEGLFFHRTLPCSVTSLYLNRIGTKIGKKMYSTQRRTAFKKYINWSG